MNKEERRKQDKEWIKYFLGRIASYWIVALEVVPLIIVLEVLGIHEIAFMLIVLITGFIIGVETMLGTLRSFCIRKGIDTKTFRGIGI